jgi:hypothetical protein
MAAPEKTNSSNSKVGKIEAININKNKLKRIYFILLLFLINNVTDKKIKRPGNSPKSLRSRRYIILNIVIKNKVIINLNLLYLLCIRYKERKIIRVLNKPSYELIPLFNNKIASINNRIENLKIFNLIKKIIVIIIVI